MAVPTYIDDGDYSKPQQVGCDEFSLPFSDKGDQVSFEVRRVMRQDVRDWRPSKPMLRIKNWRSFAYLVMESDPRNIGNGILEWEQTFASLPETRTEGGSIVHDIQFLSTQVSYDFENPPAEPSVAAFSLTMSADIVYEYFLERPEPIFRPRVEVVFGNVIKLGGWGQLTPGQKYAAEDSEVGIYKGQIFYRRTPYVTWPIPSNA